MKINLGILLSIIFTSILLARVSASTENQSKHFVLVHGGCMGGWSWFRLIPLLKSYGHNVTTFDLAASGVNLFPLDDIQNLTDYGKPLMDFMASIPANDKVILVGHSFGGGPVSQAMELFSDKISAAVFLTAAMPGPTLPFSEILTKGLANVSTALDNKLIFDDGPNNPPTSFLLGPQFLAQNLYQLSPPEDAELAAFLVRPLPFVTGEELVFSGNRYGSVHRIFIISEKDMAIPNEFQEWMIQRNPPNEVLRIGGSDHMVMSSQPSQLAARLADIARNLS